MQKHSLVLWPFHGVFGSGPTLDETFGLIDTAEKSAQVLVKVYSMGGMKQTISREELIALVPAFRCYTTRQCAGAVRSKHDPQSLCHAG